jgi:hypothetical protein
MMKYDPTGQEGHGIGEAHTLPIVIATHRNMHSIRAISAKIVKSWEIAEATTIEKICNCLVKS